MLQTLSRYRSQLMGLMILWIMVFHVDVPLPPNSLGMVKQLGYAGVDGFLFLSGMGLYRSLHGSRELKPYFIRRLRRILPVFYPVLFLWFAWILFTDPSQEPLNLILSNLTGHAFWGGTTLRFDWYVESLWVFYGLAPLLAWLMDLPKKRYIGAAFLCSILIGSLFFGQFTLIAVSRLPIFIVGLWAGKRLTEGRELRPAGELGLLAAALAGLWLLWLCIHYAPDALWTYGGYWYPFLLITPAMLGLPARCLALLDRPGPLRLVHRLLKWLGEASLELYLVHVFFFEGLGRNSPATLALSVLLALGYHRVMVRVMAWMEKTWPVRRQDR